MSSLEQDDLLISSNSESEEEISSTLTQQAETDQPRSWPSISSIMTLFSGSRTNSDNSEEIMKGDETIDEELSCPICQDIMSEVFSTKCGHSFCYLCLISHIDRQPNCPLCRSHLTKTDIHPNFQLNRLAEYRAKSLKQSNETSPKYSIKRITKQRKLDHSTIAKSLSNNLPYEDLVSILKLAMKERKNLDINENKIKQDMLRYFLIKLNSENNDIINQLLIQNDYIAKDIKELVNEEQQLDVSIKPRKRRYLEMTDPEKELEDSGDDCQQSLTILSEYENSLNLRLDERFPNLKKLYANTIVKDNDVDKRKKLLSEFSSTMYELVRYSGYEIIDRLIYADGKVGSTIVSSIEFDRDDEFFAVGGVTRQIKIFDFNMMGRYTKGVHCPTRIMNCVHKISCLSWNPYIKSQLASSDYQGYINIWDILTGQKITQYEEHKRRAWSVDICHQNPTILASASDDTTVKVWSLSQPNSIYTLEQKGNVCCAKFAPNSSHYLAVGSADHFVTCFDLRFPKQPVKIYEGHKKAVSYVKWLNDDEIISASTDSTLKLWDRESTQCKRTYVGHQNEKNFVGLSINGDWISCGSETNTVYTYHKTSEEPVTKFKFPPTSVEASDINENDIFVSSVCWKQGTNSILAANSKGIITALEMK